MIFLFNMLNMYFYLTHATTILFYSTTVLVFALLFFKHHKNPKDVVTTSHEDQLLEKAAAGAPSALILDQNTDTVGVYDCIISVSLGKHCIELGDFYKRIHDLLKPGGQFRYADGNLPEIWEYFEMFIGDYGFKITGKANITKDVLGDVHPQGKKYMLYTLIRI